MVAHGFNAGLAVVFGSQGSGNDNACAWYLINIVLDTTLGIAASYVIMGGLEKLQERFGANSHIHPWLCGSQSSCVNLKLGRLESTSPFERHTTLYLHFFARFQWSALDSGYYGHPPSWKTWFKQVLVWLSVVFLAKLVVTAFVFLGEDRLAIIGQLLMYPFRNHPKLELLVVMLLFPFALNVVAFWLFDNLLKKSVNKATAYWITYESLKPVHRERVFML